MKGSPPPAPNDRESAEFAYGAAAVLAVTAFLVDYAHMAMLDPQAMRTHLGDRCHGGHYRMAEEVTGALWAIGIEETREAIAQWP